MKTFSFPENSISGKYLFSGNAFTRTKRSLNVRMQSITMIIVYCAKCAFKRFMVQSVIKSIFMVIKCNFLNINKETITIWV